jgi:hypothetical protein
MDMRIYYRKIRENEERISEDAVVVKSLETPDGGKAGVLTEVSRRNAAILITELRAELASEEEARHFRDTVRTTKLAIDQAEAGRRVQMSLVPSDELENLKSGKRSTKG